MAKCKNLKSYLKTMAKQIRSPYQRRACYREVKAHLLESIDSKVESGMSYDKAETQALDEATDAKILGKKLNLASRPWFLRSPILTYSFLCTSAAFLILVIGSHLIVNQVLLPKINQERSSNAAFLDLFENDLILLEKDPIFEKSLRQSDAAEFLSDKLTLLGQTPDPHRNTQLNALFEKYRKEWKNNPLLLLESPLTNNLESHWISQIKKFDHWNIFNIPYVKNKIRDIGPRDSIEKVTVFSSLPIPEIRELAYWGVLYAIHKIKLNQSKEGLETLRHIAFLSTTTHTLIGQAIAVSVLRYETILAKHFQIRNWEMISENRIEALKRSSWGWASLFSNNLFWGDIDSRWKKYYFTQTGFCAGLNEFPIGVNLLAEFLTDSAPFEDKFSLRLDTSRKAALHFAQSCQSEGLIPFLKQGERIPMWGKSEALWMTFFSRAPISTSWMKSLVQLLPNPAHVPYLRRVIGLYIYSIATPNFLGPYRNLKAKKSPI